MVAEQAAMKALQMFVTMPNLATKISRSVNLATKISRSVNLDKAFFNAS